MDYEKTLEWMFNQIPMYQRTGKAAYKVDLELTHKLDEYLGHPHKTFKTIHVAGTNGKGSVSHILASILQSAGYKTGLYTSPHLKDFRERIRVNGQMIEKDFVSDFIEKNRDYFMEIKPSFFEMTVAMAFDYFRKQAVDVAVIEVGMGGRLDSTNIINPEVTTITNIGLDHTQFLGDTVEEIAFEKGGTIKNNVPVVIGETNKKTKPIFQDIAKKQKAPIFFADQEFILKNKKIVNDILFQYDVHNGKTDNVLQLETDLLGGYQVKNITTALKVVDVLRERGLHLTKEHVREGVKNVTRNTGFRGRWFVLSKNPLVVCDTAHNQEGLRYTLNQLNEMNPPTIHFVLGFVNDKKLENILNMFPKEAVYYFTKANIPRALNEKELAEKAEDFNLRGETYPEVHRALEAAKAKASKDDVIYIGGSTFVVSEVL